jgi:hypothetical protein
VVVLSHRKRLQDVPLNNFNCRDDSLEFITMNLSTFASALRPKHWANLARLFRNHAWERNDDGEILIGHARIGGVFSCTAPDGLGECATHNLITTEGANYLLSVGLGNVAAYSKFYIAPFSGNITVTDALTAATFAGSATEITTYSEATRVEFVETVPALKSTNNVDNAAVFTASQDNVNIWGVGLLSTATKSATTGVLLSAAKYSTVRNLPTTGDTLGVKYTLTLSNS